MTKTARRILPAVAVLATLGVGLGSATTLNSTSAASARTPARAPATTAVAPTTTAAPTTTVAATTSSASSADATAEVAAAQRPLSAPPPPDDPLARCGTSGGTYRPTTEADFREAMTGAWLLCQSPSFFGTDEAGIELRADGRWSKLERTAKGQLRRTAGWGSEGIWESVDVSAMNGTPTYQINFRADGSTGVNMTIPEFGAGPDASTVSNLRLSNMGFIVADYVPVAPGTKILPAPSGPPPVPADRCDTRNDDSYAPTSETEFRAVMTRTWLLCGGPSFFGTDEVGLEIRSDGRWSKLYRTSDGRLIRAHGPENEGTWTTADVSAMNGRPLFSIEFSLDGAGSIGTVPVFARHGSQVSKARLDNMGVFVADYVPARPGTAIVE